MSREEGEERERPLPACDHDVFFHVATNHIILWRKLTGF